MHVIGQSLHESIRIGNAVTVELLQVGEKRVTLGIHAPPSVEISPAESPGKPVGRSAGHDREMLNVLVVDNTPIHAWLIDRTLTAYGGVRTRLASDGRAAMQCLGLADVPTEGPTRYDLIIMESHFPDIAGVELLRRIRLVPSLKTVPVIVLSEWHCEAEVARCLEAGANALIPKPHTRTGFADAVRRIADFWMHACRAPADPLAYAHDEPILASL